MRKRTTALAGALLLAVLAGTAPAAGLPGAAKGLAPAAAGTGGGMVEGLLGKVEPLRKSNAGATKSLAEGRAKVLAAFSMKDEAAKARAGAARVASGGATAADVEEAVASGTRADEAILAALAQKRKLGAEGKKQFAAGLRELAAGLKQQAAVAVSAKGLSSDLDVVSSGGGLPEGPKAAAAAEYLGALGAQLPKGVASARDTLSACAEFGKAAGVPLPKGVDEALAAAGQVAP